MGFQPMNPTWDGLPAHESKSRRLEAKANYLPYAAIGGVAYSLNSLDVLKLGHKNSYLLGNLICQRVSFCFVSTNNQEVQEISTESGCPVFRVGTISWDLLMLSKWSSGASKSRWIYWKVAVGLTSFACLDLFASGITLAQISPALPAPSPPSYGYADPPLSGGQPQLRPGSSAQIAPQQRVTNKSAVPAISHTSDGQTFDGQTFVALASGLQSVFNGREPTSLNELKALELQQSLVAKSIERVTVNVQQGSAQGSGVIITADGYVLTAAHVAGGKDRDAWVILSDGTQLKARTLGMNRDKDAGLLKIEDSRFGSWPYATIGKSSDLNVGQWCVASGHPGGWKPERGAVIRVGRVLKISQNPNEKSAHTLFTDCALIGGDSGGPLFTLEGKLIGIHSRIGTDVEDNMHVPIDVFAISWDRMVSREVWGMLPGYQPVIGVSGSQNDDRPLVASLAEGGPAKRAGLQVGDLILTFDRQSVRTFADLRNLVMASMPGDTVWVTFLRQEQELRLALTIGVVDN